MQASPWLCAILFCATLIVSCQQRSTLFPSTPSDGAFAGASLPDAGAWAPLTTVFDEFAESERAGAQLTGSTATLNGREVRDPAWLDEPLEVDLNGVEPGKLGLILLRATSIPATTHRVLASFFADGKLVYNTSLVANGAINNVCLDLQSDNLTVRLHNSYVGGTWPEACAWELAAVTRPAEDPGEPNNLGNGFSTDGRSVAQPIEPNRTIHASFFHRNSDGMSDLVDWYQMDVIGGREYAFITSGVWDGPWNTYLIILITSLDVQLVHYDENFSGSKKERRFTAPGQGAQRIYLRIYNDLGRGYPVTGTARFARYHFRIDGPLPDPQWTNHAVATLSDTPIQLNQYIIDNRPLLLAAEANSTDIRVWVSHSPLPDSPSDWSSYTLPAAVLPDLTERAPFVGTKVGNGVALITNTAQWYQCSQSMPLTPGDWRSAEVPHPCGTTPPSRGFPTVLGIGYATLVDDELLYCGTLSLQPELSDWEIHQPFDTEGGKYTPTAVAALLTNSVNLLVTSINTLDPAQSDVREGRQSTSNPDNWTWSSIRHFTDPNQRPVEPEYWNPRADRRKYRVLSEGTPSGKSTIWLNALSSGIDPFSSHSVFAESDPATTAYFLPSPEIGTYGLITAAISGVENNGARPFVEVLRSNPATWWWCSYTVPTQITRVVEYSEPGSIAAVQLANLDNHMAVAFLRPEQREIVFARETTGW